MSDLQGERASLLLVHDSNGNIFGGFASAVWEVRAQYYGNGECFLFSLGRSLGPSRLPGTQAGEIRARGGSAEWRP